jgi:two-component system response regulator FlrC
MEEDRDVMGEGQTNSGLQGAMDANEFRIIVETIKNTRTRKEAADVLGISQRTLRYKVARMREKGITVPKRRSAKGVADGSSDIQ